MRAPGHPGLHSPSLKDSFPGEEDPAGVWTPCQGLQPEAAESAAQIKSFFEVLLAELTGRSDQNSGKDRQAGSNIFPGHLDMA